LKIRRLLHALRSLAMIRRDYNTAPMGGEGSKGESLLRRELSIWKRRLSWLQVFRIGVRLPSMLSSLTEYPINSSSR